jgi:hypothetical protein
MRPTREKPGRFATGIYSRYSHDSPNNLPGCPVYLRLPLYFPAGTSSPNVLQVNGSSVPSPYLPFHESGDETGLLLPHRFIDVFWLLWLLHCNLPIVHVRPVVLIRTRQGGNAYVVLEDVRALVACMIQHKRQVVAAWVSSWWCGRAGQDMRMDRQPA